jgi:hypothetical protein
LNKLPASLLACFAAAAGASPSDEDLARCAAVASREARLACYDVLAHRPPDKAPTVADASSPVAAPAIAPEASSAAVVTAATSAASASASAASAADPNNFGLTAKKQRSVDEGPKSIAARISSVSSDQSGGVFIVLDSGQIWTVLDNDGRLAAGDAVTIKRAALSSFLMMTPSNHSYRVRRVK